jgi:hypothetical protein
MKCSKCQKEAVGFRVTERSEFRQPLIIEARCKEHLKE